MKNYYKINEISKLYDIGVDSIRYYERLGILHPKRGENHYRQYTTQDIQRLNIIRDLRHLDFSMQAIKAYLEEQSIASTLSLMEQEEAIINEKMKELTNLRKNIIKRKEALSMSQHITFGQITMLTYQERKCVALHNDMVEDDVDIQLIKLSKEHEKNIFMIGNFNTGYFLNIEQPDISPYGVFICGDTLQSYEFKLPPGKYLTCYYQGTHTNRVYYLNKMLSYCKQHSLIIDSLIMEFLIIDEHETKHEDEFISQLQIKLKDDKKDTSM